MKKTLAVFSILSMLTLSGCALGVSTAQPPHVGFYGHPSLVVIPGTYVYAMTDIGEDIFFHVGWWWRVWDGRWYKSRYYDRGWNHYSGVPGFYHEVDPGWRNFYRNRRWHGHPWECERITAPRVQQDWNRWQDSRYWEKEKNWGVRGFRPAPYRHSDRESMRDDSRFPQPDRHQKSRFEDRQRGTGLMPSHRQEFSPARETSRPGQPYFESRRTDDREAGTRGGDRYHERQKSPRQQTFERPRRDDREAETKRDRQYGEQQDYRPNRPSFQQERRESGEMHQQGREQFREQPENRSRTPMFEPREREARPERFQQRDGSGSRESQFQSRQREASQEKPQRQERNRENRRRPAQEFPGQGSGESGASAGDISGTMQTQ
jgi:hypothetical protein